MRASEFDDLVDKLWQKGNEIRAKKRKDYATEDVLSNFKRMGKVLVALRIPELLKIKPSLAFALCLMLLKLDRLINLTVRGEKPVNESKEDTWIDMLQYLILAYGCDVDEEGG